MQTTEERLSGSIVYNLQILLLSKPYEHLEEFLTKGLFLKSNTQSFIHVTYYLFNILDPQEFRKKFYWPIVDKKSENAYRTSSVDFINSLIEKYKIKQDKIKLVTVVHPHGKKFMSLILDLIIVTLKEVMKHKNYDTNVHPNLENAEIITDALVELEDIIDSESKMVRDKINEIRELINSIYPDDSSIPFEEFILNWHELNKQRLKKVMEQREKVKEIYEKADLLTKKGLEMLKQKDHKIKPPTDEEIKALNDFYQNTEMPIDKNLNIVPLILHLESSLSVILNYIQNFSLDEFEITDEEMNIVKQHLEEMKQFEPMMQKLSEKQQKLKEKAEKVLKLKAEQDEVQDDDDKLLDVTRRKEVMQTLLSPKKCFETAKSSMNMVNKQQKLALDDVDHSMQHLNQTRLYRPLSDTCLNKSKEMGPPKSKDAPSRRRKRDPMAILDKALASSKSKSDLNATAVNTGTIPKMATSTPFSSTMLSPDLIHHANFSMISNISTVSQTPYVPGRMLSVPHPISKPDVLSMNQLSNDLKVMSLEENFQRKVVFDEIDQNVANSLAVPKATVNEETSFVNEFSSSCENTVCEKENFGSEMDTVMFMKKPACEEDLFNVSDSVLVDD